MSGFFDTVTMTVSC